MTNSTAKIRAALEMARDYITSDLASERGAFEGYEGLSRIGEIKADLTNNEEALAALAELEKSASPQFVAGEVTDDVAARVLTHFSNFPVRLSNAQNGHDMIAAVRSELGPALGLVEIREPTPEECERIDSVYASLDRTSHGRAMFNAVKIVMWPKEGL